MCLECKLWPWSFSQVSIGTHDRDLSLGGYRTYRYGQDFAVRVLGDPHYLKNRVVTPALRVATSNPPTPTVLHSRC